MVRDEFWIELKQALARYQLATDETDRADASEDVTSTLEKFGVDADQLLEAVEGFLRMIN